jgi:1-acyl-sn-glycerol-3-phosphate acyltransferase
MVDRKKRDASGTREAIKHINNGGAVGIFPEGGIERPARTLRPFQAGVGFLIRRTGAPVLPIVIQGTPYSESVWDTYWTRGRAVVEFKPQIRYTGKETAEEIAADLQRRYQEWTGWPVRDPEA